MTLALVYCKEGGNRELISRAIAPAGIRANFTSDPSGVTRLIAEINPVIYIQDWQSLDLSRSTQILRLIDNTDRENRIVRVIVTEVQDPSLLAVANESGVRRILTYSGLGMELKKVVQMVQLGPGENQKKLNEAKKLRENGKFEEAFKIVDYLLQKDSKSPDIKIEHANLAYQLGKTELARKETEQILAEDGNYIRALNLLSRILMKDRDFEGAEKILEKANVLSPKHADRLTLLGQAYYGKGDFTKATQAFTEALSVEPSHKDAVKGLGTVKLEQGDTQALIDLFNNHSSEAETAGFFNNAAVQNVHAGKLEEGLKLYEVALQALKSDNYKALVYFNMGLNYRRMQRFEDAHKAFKRALRYEPGYEKAQRQLKEVEAQMQKKPA